MTRYLALVHNERDSHGVPVAKVIHNFGREDTLTRQALARLADSIQYVLDGGVTSPADGLVHLLSASKNGNGASDALVAAEQGPRARILQAMVEISCERGFARASVSAVSRQAGASTRTFYDHFNSLEDCFLEVIDEGAQRALEVMLQAFAKESSWLDALRTALAALLVLFDTEPARARVWHLESLAAGRWALEHRAQSLGVLRTIILREWSTAPESPSVTIAAEGAMAAVLGVLHTRLLQGPDAPLLEVLGPLIGLVVAPFVSADVRAREIRRGEEFASTILDGYADPPDFSWPPGTQPQAPSPLAPAIADRITLCLMAVAEMPGSSNGEIAARIGVAHGSQISRLLSTLAGRDLVASRPRRPGSRNEWCLTDHGERVAGTLRTTTPVPQPKDSV
ncbi:MAG: TetR/AcrR family transcriptional regulator [Solirubrobacteraceae bacterium]